MADKADLKRDARIRAIADVLRPIFAEEDDYGGAPAEEWVERASWEYAEDIIRALDAVDGRTNVWHNDRE